VAAGAEKAVLEAGLRIPEDVAVIGAGNVHYSNLFRVPLSTVDMSSELLGERAAELLLARLEGRQSPPQSVYNPLRIVVRQSTERTQGAKA
jgi:LacI family transcriptional regulator